MSRGSDLPESVIVIGAGVAGLATAGLLARRGVAVTVIDKLGEVGGRAGELSADGFRWDTGPSWYLMPEAFDHFFAQMGTQTADVLDLVDLDPAYRIYGPRGHRADVRSGVDNVAALFDAVEPGAGARVRDYLARAEDTYRVALQHFLYTTFRAPLALAHRDIRRRLGVLADLLVHSLASYVARQFTHPLLQQILTYPAVFLSTEPSRAPALYSLLSHTDLGDAVRYPQGGFAAVVQAMAALAREAGASFELGAEVTEILTVPTGRTGMLGSRGRRGSRAVGVRVRQGGTTRVLYADAVVSAADLHHTETQLLPRKLQTYPERYWSPRDPGMGTVLILLGVKGELPELAHHTFLFSEDWTDDFRAVFHRANVRRANARRAHLDRVGEQQSPKAHSESIYISRTSATDPTAAPAGHDNLFVLVPCPPDADLGHGDAYGHTTDPGVADIADAVIDQIASWTGVADLRERIVTHRTIGPADFAGRYHAWRAGSIGPAHTLRQSAFLRGQNASRKVAGLYYAGATTLPGVGVPMCLISAENVVKRMLGDRSSTPLGLSLGLYPADKSC